MPYLRLISDSHNLDKEYLKLTQGCDYTIQMGDLGYDLAYLDDKIRIGRDFVNFGNHENYDKDSPHYCLAKPYSLGDYGVLSLPDFEPIFHLRGAWSIDWRWRKKQQEWPNNGPKTWFEEEELSADALEKAVQFYSEVKPNFVVTHDCPKSIVPFVTDPTFCLNFGYIQEEINTRTSVALQKMLEIHRPHTWVHGHYHSKFDQVINGTRFICLDMLGRTPDNRNAYINFDLNFPYSKGDLDND